MSEIPRGPIIQPSPEAQCEDPSKRRTIRLLAVGSFVIGAAAMGIVESIREEEEPVPQSSDDVDDINTIEVAEQQKGLTIPEDERTGKNILLMLPTDEDSKCYASNGEHMGWIESFIEGMPQGTTIMLVVPLDVDRTCFEKLAKKHTNVKIAGVALDIPQGCVSNHMAYPQDIFFPTGKTDKDGRFELIVSSLDPRLMELRFLSTVEKQLSKGVETPEIDICEAMRFLGDNLLVEKHDKRFAGYEAPISCTGGDLQITRLPNGKTGCILGKLNLANMIMGIMYGSKDPETDKNPDLAIGREGIELIKELYCRTLEVDECIIIDEDELINNPASATYGNMAYGTAFFHSDMMVKTASSPKDPSQQLAFVTNIPSLLGIGISTNTYRPDIPYLERVQNQFKELGYKVIKLPCGPWATMGYTNSIMFTRGDKKYVAVPQYGIDKDQRAVAIFENEGFEVIKVDMSFVGELEAKDKTGSVHCRTVVLN
jgi:hypothetical protein